MCKILCVAGLNPKNAKANWKFLYEMVDVLSVGNDEGFGYAAISKGKLVAEKWLFNRDAFVNRKVYPEQIPPLLTEHTDIVQGTIEKEGPRYVSYGSFEKGTLANATCVMLHARKATNKICIDNTHPFIDLETETTLIHNGVINNVEAADNIRSTCDSERILNMYLEEDVSTNTKNMTDMCHQLKGYMACGVLHKNNNNWMMDLWRSDTNNLYGVYIPGLDVIVYTSNDSDVIKTARELGYSGMSKFQLKENILIRLDCITGKLLEKQTFTGITRTYYKNSNPWQGNSNYNYSSNNNSNYNSNYSSNNQSLSNVKKEEDDDESWLSRRIGYHV